MASLAQMVRFVHETTTDKARAALFAACRDGEVALLVGSTSKVGMGTNVQTRLTHLWHVDAPWLPADVIQRDGRAIRPGNLSGHVTVTRLVTEGTFDAYTWQALERKSRSFDALYATGATAREIEDVSSATISYGEVKALASGNPLLLDQATIRAEVKKLQLMRSVHMQSIRKAEQTATQVDERAVSLTRMAGRATEALDAITAEATEDERAELTRAAAGWVAAESGANGYGLSYAARSMVAWRGMQLRPAHEHGRMTSVAGNTGEWSTYGPQMAPITPIGRRMVQFLRNKTEKGVHELDSAALVVGMTEITISRAMSTGALSDLLEVGSRQHPGE